ncbi:MAG: hypothetical protein LBQ59_01640 [Candidatus Peribacteria bacterium]|jgi:hypothetical protein|nr:hypothetical protein [Candidatus Peribacteria bacterium]
MTYEDDIRVEGEESVASSFPLTRGKELRIGVSNSTCVTLPSVLKISLSLK